MLEVIKEDHQKEIYLNFDEFWLIFWENWLKKEEKIDSYKEAKKIYVAEGQIILIPILIGEHNFNIHVGYERERQFIPSARKWFRGRRWEDEYEVKISPRHASHIVFDNKPTEKFTRCKIPENILKQIECLKAKNG